MLLVLIATHMAGPGMPPLPPLPLFLAAYMGGDLFDEFLVVERKRHSDTEAKKLMGKLKLIVIQISKALGTLHKKHIIHGDLKVRRDSIQ